MPAKLTPVLVVNDIAATVAFYQDALGFTAETVMPEENPSFASLKHGTCELMLQTVTAMREDIPAAAETPVGFSGVLYLEVDDLDATRARIPAPAIITGDREAPYGMTETILRDPNGYVVVVAQQTATRNPARETAAVG